LDDPEIPLLGIYLKEYKSGYNKRPCTPMFIAALFIKRSYENCQEALILMNGLRNYSRSGGRG
jgi:hypothetical protein